MSESDRARSSKVTASSNASRPVASAAASREVAHRRVAGIGVSAGGCGQEVGGELGRVHHGALGSGCLERAAEIVVQAAASGNG